MGFISGLIEMTTVGFIDMDVFFFSLVIVWI